jgi:D-3-phosphoglycerate dehydrogenase
MHNILCALGDTFTDEGKTILEELGEVTYVEPTQEELLTLMSDVTILICQLNVLIDKSVLDVAPNLQAIASPVTGPDNIDIAYAESKGITVLSLKGEVDFLNSVTATAEHACGLMLSLIRNIPAAHRSVLSGSWNRNAFKGHSVHGKTLGIIGYGRLGKMMARYGEGLGMNVIYADPHVDGGLTQEELLQQSDVISLHIHLEKETEGWFGKEMIDKMKPHAYLINTARGQIVDESAIIDALESDHLAGYAADVLADEHAFIDGEVQSALINYAQKHDNVIITPHTGGLTYEARSATDVFIANKLKTHLQ